MATSLAAFYAGIPVGHVEAGLRTFDKHYPFPEEMNRVVTDYVCDWHFAPTETARQNLLKTSSSEKNVFVTGNTVIDALFYTLNKTQADGHLPVKLDDSKRLILVTTHRRENFGSPLKEITQAILDITNAFEDVEVVLPVHPNPNVKPIVEEALGHHPRIYLTGPQDYIPFCHLLKKATLILTDSGGVQEEAPALGKPVLVLRDETERPEAITAGCVKLVGPHYDKIVSAAKELLSNPDAYDAMCKAYSPYGDGKACERIVQALLSPRTFQPFELKARMSI
jgi:UDP-N-acetylglucosamine 2-epimerase (non-hydrolysing)